MQIQFKILELTLVSERFSIYSAVKCRKSRVIKYMVIYMKCNEEEIPRRQHIVDNLLYSLSLI